MREPGGGREPRGWSAIAGPLIVLAAALAIWELGARASSSFLLPTASATLSALVELGSTTTLWRALWISNQSLLIGWPLAMGLGVPVGLAIGRWPAAERWLSVHLHVLLVMPKAAVMPLVVMAFGFDLATRAVIVAIFAFPVIAITMAESVRSLDRRLIDMARTFGATEWQLWRRVLLPGVRPALLTALRLGLTRAVAGMVTVELLLVAVGLGELILRHQANFDAASVYAIVIVVLAEAVVLLDIAARAERRFGVWRGHLIAQ